MTTLKAGITNDQTEAPPLEWSIGPPGQPMYFDAWLRLGHNTTLTLTQHPVETGAAITDHSYVNPKRFSFDVGMTDVVAVGKQEVKGQSTSRSVNAYNALVAMQASRSGLVLVSKYGVYNNILIADISAQDDARTKYGGRYTITLQEIIMAGDENRKVSARPQITDQTNSGQVAPLPVSQNIVVAGINAGISLNSLIRFGLQPLSALLPSLSFEQVKQIWTQLVRMKPEELLKLGISELKTLFPVLSTQQSDLLLSFLTKQFPKR